ncbi:hypothetical protein X732_22450 [Mesorhizobium sp. L2C066B000]|nr:hypothetical protein X732_22450 [Mesorhizobium sp. L2C066B000]
MRSDRGDNIGVTRVGISDSQPERGFPHGEMGSSFTVPGQEQALTMPASRRACWPAQNCLASGLGPACSHMDDKAAIQIW